VPTRIERAQRRKETILEYLYIQPVIAQPNGYMVSMLRIADCG